MLIFLKLLSVLSLGAVLDNGIFGKAKNKLGNVVLFVWKGINAARSYVIPANPNTQSQIAQRSLMKQMVSYAQIVLIPFIHKYLNPFAVKMSGYNLFIQRNRKANFPGTTWHNKIFTVGSLPLPNLLNFPIQGVQTVAWEGLELTPGLLPTDFVACLMNNKNGDFVSIVDEVPITAGILNLPLAPSKDFELFFFSYRKQNGVVTSVATSKSHIVTV